MGTRSFSVPDIPSVSLKSLGILGENRNIVPNVLGLLQFPAVCRSSVRIHAQLKTRLHIQSFNAFSDPSLTFTRVSNVHMEATT